MGHMALKLDISKAYDKVEWNFLKHVLLRLGFPPRFVDLIMLCVSSVRYSFLINGHEFGSLTPNGASVRGTRCPRTCFSYVQRPSAPWLEGWNMRVHSKGCRFAGMRPQFHIFYSDDTLIFSQASEEAMRGVARMLEIYTQASGQAINLNKSSVVFSRNMNVAL
ncbi:UNVERIFIED_CONTAM: hypothetical protein Sradi_7068900 [Sesamum radiatum]|uniref:Reverse transcriptase domain-containing protein n=1 Tax=Sesamum radiatum TaxID=300843 RepID=A0AAW2J4Z0_SESRA